MSGQRMLTTDQTEIALLDVRTVTLECEPEAPATAAEAGEGGDVADTTA